MSFLTRPGVGFGPPVQGPSGFITNPIYLPRPFDILPNGRQFIGVVQADRGGSGTATPQIQVVLNWFEEVKQRVPVR